MANALPEEIQRSIRTKYAAAAGLIAVGFLLQVYQEVLTGERGNLVFLAALASLLGAFLLPAMVCYGVTLNRSSAAKAKGWLIVSMLMAAVPAVEIAKQLNH